MKKRVGVIMGGPSAEREVALAAADRRDHVGHARERGVIGARELTEQLHLDEGVLGVDLVDRGAGEAGEVVGVDLEPGIGVIRLDVEIVVGAGTQGLDRGQGDVAVAALERAQRDVAEIADAQRQVLAAPRQVILRRPHRRDRLVVHPPDDGQRVEQTKDREQIGEEQDEARRHHAEGSRDAPLMGTGERQARGPDRVRGGEDEEAQHEAIGVGANEDRDQLRCVHARRERHGEEETGEDGRDQGHAGAGERVDVIGHRGQRGVGEGGGSPRRRATAATASS